jgi:hypothetical protein
MGAVRQDAKFGLRMLKQNPAFTAMAVIAAQFHLARLLPINSWES